MNGVLIIDKPAGLTSHDVVNRVRRILGQRSIGHLGTLDPMATGVLPVVTGGFTRLAQFYLSSEKVYEGTIRFGFSTETYDAEGEPTGEPQVIALQWEAIDREAARFRGVIEQMPPPFSAKKIKGVPAYKLARKHQEVDLKPVQVEIKEFEILSVENDHAGFRVRVASGTYVRSIAHEMGQLLGCGAHLLSLRRTRLGEFDLSMAHTLNDLDAACKSEKSDGLFIHPRQLLPEFPCVSVNEEVAALIRNGRTVNLSDLSKARHVKVFTGQKDLIAIATRIAGTLFHPKIVLVPESAKQLSSKR